MYVRLCRCMCTARNNLILDTCIYRYSARVEKFAVHETTL